MKFKLKTRKRILAATGAAFVSALSLVCLYHLKSGSTHEPIVTAQNKSNPSSPIRAANREATPEAIPTDSELSTTQAKSNSTPSSFTPSLDSASSSTSGLTTNTAPDPSSYLAANSTPSENDMLPPADLIADILAAAGDLSDPKNRAETVARIKTIEDMRFNAAVKKAVDLGYPISGKKPGGGSFMLRDFDGDVPIYDETTNINAAITTNTTKVREEAPYKLDGTGMKAGIWEPSGIALTTHQEFGGRVINKDASATNTKHATHTTGTMVASGVDSNAKGMAPAATLHAYDTSNALSEMTAAGAATATDTTRIPLSNHSYVSGGVGWSVQDFKFTWYGKFSDDNDPSNDYETDFGLYNSDAANIDSLIASLPYYLPFWAAGNQRYAGPYDGIAKWVVAGNPTERVYDSSIHPPTNQTYKGGFDNLQGARVSKNNIVVGATNDGVSNGTRSPSSAVIIGYSSRGPADDGRIKPDIVANGATVYSSENASNTSYGTTSGTSMASPNASGSAILLAQLYGKKNSGKFMRASTLKGLIIHTADDVGNPGPDYTYGWGVMNTFAAAELIRIKGDNGLGADIIENNLTDTVKTRTYSFYWPANKPIKATLCWTDPAGATNTAHDNRTPDLVNDLNITITDAQGKTFLPYVMPYVGDWTDEKITANATTGVNKVDNVEQVYIPTHAAGTFTIKISYKGTLADNKQIYSLIVSDFTAR